MHFAYMFYCNLCFVFISGTFRVVVIFLVECMENAKDYTASEHRIVTVPEYSDLFLDTFHR